jgi:hypothetical protein
MRREITSASNLYRRKLCPGSEAMEAGLPDEENDQSREGTLLHGYYTNPELDRAALKPHQRELLRIADDTDAQIIEHAERQLGITTASRIFTSGYEKELVVYANADGGMAMTNHGTRLIAGHCDQWRFYSDEFCQETEKRHGGFLVIIDPKFGFRTVTPAVANLQLRTYAVAGYQEWHPKTILVAISQPRLPYSERLTMAMYTDNDSLLAFNQIRRILEFARSEHAPRHADTEQCRYCKAKLICREYSDRLSLTLTDAPRSLAECTDVELDRILQAIQFSDFLKEQARDTARERIANGQMTNWVLGKPAEIREVADVRKAASKLLLRGLVNQEQLYEALSMSFGALEDAVRRQMGCTYKRAKELVEETLSELIERKTKRPTITRL